MQTFLNKVAKTTLHKFGENLGEVTIVLPSRRAIVFLTEEFKKEMNGGGWLPVFYSIEDFVQKLGNYIQLDKVDLIFELYKIHQELEGKNAEPFYEFIGWGSTLLQDFNEIDRYLINGQELFSFLTEAKAIEIWELESGGLTEFQHKYLSFWRRLGEYYEKFRAVLNKKNQVYQGLGFRNVAENLAEVKIEFNLIFAGFNALTEAENKILRHCEVEHNALLLWDADQYYLNDKFQEAGNFLREHKRVSKKEFNWVFDDLLTAKKNLSIYGISGNMGQSKLIGNLIQEKADVNTAVILSDEELLVPVLESIPSGVEKVNVTMGYPLSFSPVYGWLESLLQLFQNNSEEGVIENYYHKDTLKFLEHSISESLPEKVLYIKRGILNKLKTQKLIRIEPAFFEGFDKTLGFSLLNVKKVDSSRLVNSILSLIDYLKRNTNSLFDDMNKECLFGLEKAFLRLQSLSAEYKETIDLSSLLELYRQIVSRETVSFVGEPLGGLQIMGVLESRTLDFENVIISSVNEGILPSGKSHNSFIPFDIKRKYNLPSYQEKDAIFAYHFYRILQRAKNISVIYNTKVDQLQGGERSRFIEQLIHEMPRRNEQVVLKEYTVSPGGAALLKSDREIRLNDAIRQKIASKLKKGLSPSALNTFINCPLDFYYRYVLELKVDEELEEKIEDNTLGTIVHNTLENLYKPFLKRILDKETLKSIKGNVDVELMMQFKKVLNVVPEFGSHRLTFEVAKNFVLALIKHDEIEIKNGKEIIVWEVEGEMNEKIEVELIDGEKIPVTLYGKIDRVDSLNQQKRIIDFKTGKVTSGDLSYYNIQTLLNGNKSKAVQLMMYQLGFDVKGDSDVIPGIISLRNISNGFMQLKGKNTSEEMLQVLQDKISEMLRSETFQHNKGSHYCNFCE